MCEADAPNAPTAETRRRLGGAGGSARRGSHGAHQAGRRRLLIPFGASLLHQERRDDGHDSNHHQRHGRAEAPVAGEPEGGALCRGRDAPANGPGGVPLYRFSETGKRLQSCRGGTRPKPKRVASAAMAGDETKEKSKAKNKGKEAAQRASAAADDGGAAAEAARQALQEGRRLLDVALDLGVRHVAAAAALAPDPALLRSCTGCGTVR